MNIEQAKRIAKAELFKSYANEMFISNNGRAINLSREVYNLLMDDNCIVFEDSRPTYLGAIVFKALSK